jgi:uncharacterized membrane protein
MNFQHLIAQPTPIPLHAIAALLAILIGGWQLFAHKGDRPHKILGYIWISLILIVSVSSFWIHTFNHFGPFSAIHLLSVFTIVTTLRAVRSARAGKIIAHQRQMKSLYALALILTGAFTLLPGRVMHTVLFMN